MYRFFFSHKRHICKLFKLNKFTPHQFARHTFSPNNILPHVPLCRILPIQHCLTPAPASPPLPNQPSPPLPSVHISNRVELFQCITLKSLAGMGVLPQIPLCQPAKAASTGCAPPIPPCQTRKAASCFENFPHHANWQRHAFQKPTANLLIIIYLQRPSGCKSCKNHTWYVRSLSC